jgi:hypothetical protein
VIIVSFHVDFFVKCRLLGSSTNGSNGAVARIQTNGSSISNNNSSNINSNGMNSIRSSKGSRSRAGSSASAPSAAVSQASRNVGTATGATSTGTANSMESHTAGGLAPAPVARLQTALLDLTEIVIKDPAECRVFLNVIRHFLQSAVVLQQKMSGSSALNSATTQAQVQAGQSVSTGGDSGKPAEEAERSASDSSYISFLEPMLLIDDGDRVTKMVCPSLGVVAKHSAPLAAYLTVSLVF